MGGIAVLVGALILAGCEISPTPFTEEENAARVQADLDALFAEQERLAGPIMLEEAIARALSYNLDHRLKLMERAVSVRQLDVAHMSLLPSVAANAGYDQRSHSDSTFNQTKTATSTTSDRTVKTADLTISWNILDFGVSYIRAKQQADIALITEERRRQVVHNVMKDTREAYWSAAAAERALRQWQPLLESVNDALSDAKTQVAAQVDGMNALVYQRTLLETLRQLENLRREMVAARTRLAVLMNVHPDSEFSIADAEGPAPVDPISVQFNSEAIEVAALRNRSEVRSAAYQHRINREEARVALLRMLPGIDLSSGLNYTTDSFKANQRWFDASMALTWNVLNLISGPANIELAETTQELSRVRRLALSMAVIAQVNVSQLRYASAIRDFTLANEIAEVENEIQRQVTRASEANSASPQDVIEVDVRAALANFRRDQAYAAMQSAFGDVIAATGADPLIEPAEDGGIMVLAGAIGKALEKWEQGEFAAPARWVGEAESLE